MTQTSTLNRPLFFISNLFVTIVAVLSMLLPAKPNNVTLNVSAPVTTETTVITFEIENRTRRTISYPEESFCLEEQTADGWNPVEEVDHGVNEPMYQQRTGLTAKEQIDLSTVYGGPLGAGVYRLTFFYNVGSAHCSAQTTFTVTAM
ncbi:MAG: hypothetical protein IKN72_08290 [Clostridia bacterium]|nr:hypothetical protein [Clostridia bacterium]